MTDGRVRLAVLGEPLAYTRSPELHRAGLEALGLAHESQALRTPPEALGGRLRELAARGYRGVNLTVPLKEAVIGHLHRVSDAARRARSVNTVGFERDGWWGETTDGEGFVELLGSLGRVPAGERVVLLGAGGAARSLGAALADSGCAGIAVSARRPAVAADAWREIGEATIVGWRSTAERSVLARATLVVNAAPVPEGEDPAPLDLLPPDALVVDLRYGRALTPWVRAARASGRLAYDGLGPLAFQARRSLSLWTGRDVPLDPLARAVGWPR